jgi:ribosomal protein L29
MKLKDKKSIAGMTVEELKGAIAEINGKLTGLRLKTANKQSRNSRETRELRKRKAVILTCMTEKEITKHE